LPGDRQNPIQLTDLASSGPVSPDEASVLEDRPPCEGDAVEPGRALLARPGSVPGPLPSERRPDAPRESLAKWR